MAASGAFRKSPTTLAMSEFGAKWKLAAISKLPDLMPKQTFGVEHDHPVSRRLVDSGYLPGYDRTLQILNELKYDAWREYDAEDSMRFYALRMQEVGFIKSSPQEIIAKGTDRRFLNELKRELKA
jgi:NitT/TauT family transport system substrate-binding protein